MENKKKLLEAILFLENNPISLTELEEILDITQLELNALITQFETSLREMDSVLTLDRVDGKLYLRPDKLVMESLWETYGEKDKKRFSRATMEVLSIVAWKQPATRSDIEAIRGVDSTNSLRTLVSEDFIKVVGKKEVLGRPQTYGTTEKFLKYFGLSSLNELPRIEDLNEMFDIDSVM